MGTSIRGEVVKVFALPEALSCQWAKGRVSAAVPVELPVSASLQPAALGCFDYVVAFAPTSLNMTIF